MLRQAATAKRMSHTPEKGPADMTMDQVQRTIRTIVQQEDRFVWASNHETMTRYMVVDPILRALGWHLSDPKQCIVEFPIYDDAKEGRIRYRVDYVLFDARQQPIIIIEAKNIQWHTRNEDYWDQMDDYLECFSGLKAAVLTNGEYWDIAKYDSRGNLYGENDKPLGLTYPNYQENARRLFNALGKSNYWK